MLRAYGSNSSSTSSSSPSSPSLNSRSFEFPLTSSTSSSSFLLWTTMTSIGLTTTTYEGSQNIDVVGDVIYDGYGRTMITEKTEDEEVYTPYGDRPETYIVPIVFLLILVIGLTGNGVLAFTIIRHRNMRNVPNTYVLSLALGDLLVIVTCVPFTFTVYILDSWPFGPILCKVSECAKDISIGVSVFTLTALSADRFFAIASPMKKFHATGSGKRPTRINAIIAGLIWILAIICAIPASFAYIRDFKVNKNITFQACYPFPETFGPNYPKIILICRFFIYYALPLSIIGVFYMLMARHLVRSTKMIPGEMQGQVKQVKARKKVARMVTSFVIIFAVCFFPQHVFMLWFYIHPTSQKDYNAFWHCFRILGFCLAFTNSCINPIALYCVGGTFRKYFDRYLLCCMPKRMKRRHYRRSSEMSSRRIHSFTMVSTRRYTNGSSRREQRNAMQLSALVGDAKTSNAQSREQETIISLAGCQNGLLDEPMTKDQQETELPFVRHALPSP